MIKQPWEMSWSEWVRYYESPKRGYGNRFLFAQFAHDNFGISSQGGEPVPSESGINSRERWYRAIKRLGSGTQINIG
ncbi:unnamed protein product [marine sediment metagenome]|uniref:Uncharacterized protein n=1 Tax=marine sediment metagenome TaxID=412755 RepID=X1B4A6_9ZZZZ